MDSTVVYRRTPKGEQEISRRSLPHEPWLALVMVDGRASAADLASLEPRLPDVAQSLERLLREGYIEAVPEQSASRTSVPDREEAPVASWAREHAPSPIDLSGLAKRWGRRAGLLLPFLLVAVGLFLVHESLERFASRVEDSLGRRFRDVSIGSSAIVFTPRPALKLNELAVGRSFRVREVVAQPSWSTLFGRPGSIKLLTLREARFTAADLVALLQSGTAPLLPQELRPERVTLQEGTLDLDGVIAAPLTGELSYAPTGQFERAKLSLADGRFDANIAASAVELSARNWSSPTVPAVTFERLDATGNLEGSRLVLDRVEALLHDGLVKGDMVLDWSVGLLAEGRFSATNLDAQTLIGGLSDDFSMGGRLDAAGSFAARASNAGALIENLSVSADFRVKRGVLYNADIQAAALGDAHSGTTRFDELTGNVQTAGRNVSFRRVQLGSGLLTAAGALDVTPSRQIMGRFTVRLKSRSDIAHTISVAGTVREPKLQLGG